MKTDFDKMKQEVNTGNSVIERGYKIYDEWIENGYSSRKIVRFTERAVASVQSEKTSAACAEALSCLFALDMRIKEKYNSLLRCIFSYFSWRRETHAFKLLRGAFNASEGNTDIRTLIEIELHRLREETEAEHVGDEDDTTGGGKRNEKSEEEPTVSEEKDQDQSANDDSEELSETEERVESAEEKADEISEPSWRDDQTESIEAEQNAEEAPIEDTEFSAQDRKEEKKEEISEIKEENNGLDEKSEPSADKSKEIKTYNDAVDSPPLYEERSSDKSTAKTSFVDEVIVDNMVKGKEDFVWHNPVDDVTQSTEADRTQNVFLTQAVEKGSSNKDAYLYDKMIITQNAESKQQTEKAPAVKSEEQKSFVQKNDKLEPVKPQAENFREPLQVDISHVQENEMRMELSSNMTSEAIEAIKEAQSAFMSEQLDILDAEREANANAMRERLTIAGKDLGMNDTDKTARVSEPNVVSSPSVTQNRK